MKKLMFILAFVSLVLFVASNAVAEECTYWINVYGENVEGEFVYEYVSNSDVEFLVHQNTGDWRIKFEEKGDYV